MREVRDFPALSKEYFTIPEKPYSEMKDLQKRRNEIVT